MEWKNEVTHALKIAYPFVQAPMLGITTPQMVAAISNNGGLGSLPVGGLSPEKTLALIRQTKALTDKPFAVNLFAHPIPEFDAAQASAMQNALINICARHHIQYPTQVIENIRFYHYSEQIEILVTENIPIVSFTFGILSDEAVKTLKANGVILIGTATCVKEALILDEKGIDMISAQGIEAGGHRGTFLNDEPLPLIGSMALVPQILSRVNKPVIAAGGIYDGKTTKAAFALGAKGVQVGTAFIASHESLAIPAYKALLPNTLDTDTVLTRAFSGRWARGIGNQLMNEVEQAGIEIPGYPMQNSLISLLRAEAQKANNKDFTTLWAGQSASKAEGKAAADIFWAIIRQAEEV